MRYRKIGKSGLEASVVGLGTWVMGGGSVWGSDASDAESMAAIHAAIDAGINLIDTAPAYGFGRGERVVGKALRGRRDKVILATKCGLWWREPRGSYFCEFDGKSLYRSLRPGTIKVEIEQSLMRLYTDCIDLYQIHWPAILPDKTPVEDTMAILTQLKDQGKIRHIGVCNLSREELAEYMACGPIASHQFRYSALWRDAEEEVLPFCKANDIGTLTYMSLEQGLLTGKVGMDREFNPDEFRSNEDWNPWFAPENRRKVLGLLAGWKDLTEKYGCTFSQLVIGWTAAQEGVTHVLVGARKVKQAVENAAGGSLVLDPNDVKRMRQDVAALGKAQAMEVMS